MTLSLLGVLAGAVADVPVDPDGDQARRWILEELSKAEYQAAKPTWWDLLSKAFWDWFNSLDLSGAGILQGPLLVFLIILIGAAIVVAFVIFGRPRRNRRSLAGALFGEDESRTAEQLRRAASAAASSGDWALAIEELFRALARGVDERVLVATVPGTTASGFARLASAVFPGHADRLASGAAAFDGVRYLGEPGTEEDYRALVALEGELRTARPATVEPLAFASAALTSAGVASAGVASSGAHE